MIDWRRANGGFLRDSSFSIDCWFRSCLVCLSVCLASFDLLAFRPRECFQWSGYRDRDHLIFSFLLLSFFFFGNDIYIVVEGFCSIDFPSLVPFLLVLCRRLASLTG